MAHYREVAGDPSWLLVPAEEEVRKILSKGEEVNVIAPYEPPSDLAGLFLVEPRLPDGGVLPSQHIKVIKEMCGDDAECVKRMEEKYIQQTLGLKIVESKLRMADFVGMPRAVELLDLIRRNENDPDCRFKAILAMGVAGAGKSYLAKIIAGEMGWLFVEFNLSKIFEQRSPVLALHSTFSYLETIKDRKILLWIDEIEKMFASMEGEEKRVLGQLLTIINDLGTPEGYQVDAMIYATANDISVFLDRAPELLRAGRFDLLVFFDTPTLDGGIQIFKYYCERLGVEYSEEDLRDFIMRANERWKREKSVYSATEAERILYTPSEIVAIVKWAKRLRIPLKEPELSKREEELHRRVEPVVYYATDVVNKIRNIATAFVL